MSSLPPRMSFEQYTSSEASDTEASPSSHTALISTRDLMALDRYSADKVAALTGSSLLAPMYPHIQVTPPGTSASARYLPPGAQPLHIPAYDGHPVALPPAYSNALSPGSPPPLYGTSLTIASPMNAMDLTAMPASAPAAGNDIMQYQHSPRPHSRLAPDSKGQTIPLDATWTKVDRKLVSPEVLETAGVRYEARPNFVAVLGILTREEIEDFARKSFQVRNARTSPTTQTGSAESQGRDRSRQETYSDHYRRRARRAQSAKEGGPEGLFDASDSDSSSDDGAGRRGSARNRSRGRYAPKEDYSPNRSKQQRHPEDSEDDGPDGNRGTKVYPFIISPPASVVGESLSPSSTVAPKPILKNKNPNHVRFDRSGPHEISPGQYSSSDRQRRDRERDRLPPPPRDRDRDRDRDRPRRDKSPERSRDRSRVADNNSNNTSNSTSTNKDRDPRDRDQDHRPLKRVPSDRDRDRDQRGGSGGGGRGGSGGGNPGGGGGGGGSGGQDDRERDRASRRSAFKEAAGVIGVSGAAATLLSVLTQAVHHL